MHRKTCLLYEKKDCGIGEVYEDTNGVEIIDARFSPGQDYVQWGCRSGGSLGGVMRRWIGN